MLKYENMTGIDIIQIDHTQEAYPLDNMPTISVDRALGHILNGLELNFDALKNFYNALPHANKPSLSDLSIHFSASSVLEGKKGDETGSFGQILWDGTKSDKPSTTPELDKTNHPTIIIYVGTAAGVMPSEQDEYTDTLLAEELTETLSHELTHYAQGEISKRLGKAKRLGYKALASSVGTLSGITTDTNWLKVGTAGLISSEALTDNGLPNSLKVAAGTAAIIHIAGKGKRQRALMDKAHSNYLERDREEDARHHEDGSIGLVGATGFTVNKALLDKMTINMNKGVLTAATRSVARDEHKKLAFKVPRLNR